MTVTVAVTWIQQETVEMPQLHSIDEVVEVLEPLEEAVSAIRVQINSNDFGCFWN